MSTADSPGAPPAFPGAPVLEAQPAWQCLDFISDIHLHDGLPRTTAALARYLADTPADALFILGDLFEAWVGDDMRTQPHEAACLQLLREAAQLRPVFIMVGNRDFLVGADFLADCGATALPDPTVLEAFGERALLIHGDALCLTDTAYLRFRAQVRHPAWQQAFLAHPLATRLAQALQMREASQTHQQSQAQTTGHADVDERCAGAWMQAAGCGLLIHGHTHQPGSQAFGPGVRHVLSDWDLDHSSDPARQRAEVLRWQTDGLHRIAVR